MGNSRIAQIGRAAAVGGFVAWAAVLAFLLPATLLADSVTPSEFARQAIAAAGFVVGIGMALIHVIREWRPLESEADRTEPFRRRFLPAQIDDALLLGMLLIYFVPLLGLLGLAIASRVAGGLVALGVPAAVLSFIAAIVVGVAVGRPLWARWPGRRGHLPEVLVTTAPDERPPVVRRSAAVPTHRRMSPSSNRFDDILIKGLIILFVFPIAGMVGLSLVSYAATPLRGIAMVLGDWAQIPLEIIIGVAGIAVGIYIVHRYAWPSGPPAKSREPRGSVQR